MKWPFLCMALASCLLAASASGATVTWKSGVSGNWSDPSNWHPTGAPGPSDTAVITASGNYTVTLDTNAAVAGLVLGANDGNTQTLQLNGQTFALAGPATINAGGFIDLSNGTFFGETGAIINGTLACSGGSLTGTLTIASNGVVNLLGILGETNPITFNGLTLTNYGTVIWSNLDMDCDSGAQVYNYGLWDAKTNNAFHGNVGGGPFISGFNNYGTFRKDGGQITIDPTNVVTFFDNEMVFYNFGTLDAEVGAINISTGDGGGFYNAATDAGLSLGDFTLAGDATFSGPGQIQGNLFGNMGVIHGGLIFDYGSLTGTLTIASNGVVNLLGILGETSPITFNGLTLTNYGTVIWSNLDLDCYSGVQINNFGLWNAEMDNNFYGDSGSGPFSTVFNNFGTFRKSGGDFHYFGTWLDSSTTFNNFGTIDNEASWLEMGGNSSSGSVINTVSNAETSFDATLSGDVYFTGAGLFNSGLNGNNGVIHGEVATTIMILSGTLTLATNSVLSLSPIPQQPVYFQGTTFTNYGTVIWITNNLAGESSPEIYNYGLWDIESGNTFSGNAGGGPFFSVFNNYGTVRKDGTRNGLGFLTTFDSAITLNNFGTLDGETGSIVLTYGYGGGIVNTTTNVGLGLALGDFTLAGDMTFTGQGPVQGNFFGNYGVIHGSLNLDYGSLSGTLTIASNGVVNLVGILGETTPISFNGLTLTNYGTVIWSNLDVDCDSGAQVDNYGLWDAAANNTFHGNSGGGPFMSVFNNYGTFLKSEGAPLPSPYQTTLDGSTIFNNSGVADIQAGTLFLEDGYSLTGGTLNFGISSLGNYGDIDLYGGASLAGSLSVNFNNSYSPAAGDSFPLIDYFSETGTFTSLNLPHLPPPLAWQTSYDGFGGSAFLLNIVSPPPPQLSTAMNISGNAISFSWNGLLGQTYQAQYAANLAPANWMDLGSPVSGTNGPVTVSDTPGAPQKYYRIEEQ